MLNTKNKKNTSKKSKTKTISGSLAIIDALLKEGVTTIFGYPGGAIMPLYDALYDFRKKLNHILVRHEQGAIHAAQGFARVSGEVGVVFATSGPGATNLVTGIADAMIDSTPLVCITGQVFAHLLGTDAFQETDIINITSPITKWNFQVTDACEIPEALAKAFYIAKSGRPGPVLIDITKNAQLESFEYSGYNLCDYIRSYKPIPTIRMESIKAAIEIINRARKPFLIFGQGVLLANAESELLKFIEKSNIPAAWTIMGMGAIPTDHKLAVGMLGMHGNYGPNVLTNECDVLIAVGMRFDDRVTGRLDKYAKQAKIIHLDIDDAEIDKNVMTNVAILGDCKETLPMLTALVKTKSYNIWMDRFIELKSIEYENLVKKEFYPEKDSVTMAEVIHNLNDITKGAAIIVTDVGQHQMVACRYANYRYSRSNITSGGLGTMGFALPAAIGSKLGAPNKLVIAIMGDGGAQMNIQELGTIMQFHTNVKILILNNNFLGMVRQWQELFHEKRYSFTDIQSPDFVQVAKGYGIEGNKIIKREQLVQALKTMIESPSAYLLEIEVENQGNVFPMVPQGRGVADIVLRIEDV
jgi:acetolactate synthase-1/2/3 large subunit